MYTVITVKPPQGADAPTQVHLRNGRTVFPDAQGHVKLSSLEAVGLIAAGWQVVQPFEGSQGPFTKQRASS